MAHNPYDDDIEQHPTVIELRRALDVQRTALETQRGIIGAIHSEGEAHTRTTDHGPALRRTIDALVPLLVGMIIGSLATLATFSGRIAAVETVTVGHSAAIAAQNARFDKFDEKIDVILSRLPSTKDR